ncbi:MAG: hypothetical protein IPM79_27345 [Polyangiaceae bacterium]|nr:hypothetical protein [Polyangiaceae bacterium]
MIAAALLERRSSALLSLAAPMLCACSLIASSLLPEDGGGGFGGAGGSGASGGGGAVGGGGAEPGGAPAVGGAGGAPHGGGGEGGQSAICEPPRECVGELAQGEFVLLTREPYPSSAGLCGDGEPATVSLFGPAATAECGCSCGPHTGGACAPPPIECFQTASCTGAVIPVGLSFASVGCVAVPNQYDTLSCRLAGAVSVADDGGCAPSSPALSPPAFQDQIHACAAVVSAGCADGESCVSSDSCLALPGAVDCPTSRPERLVAYGAGDDQRACTPCTCEVIASCSGGGVLFHDNDDCTNDAPPLAVSAASCVDVSSLMDGNTGAGERLAMVLDATCAASGGAPSGAVLATEPVTYCCPLGGLP